MSIFDKLAKEAEDKEAQDRLEAEAKARQEKTAENLPLAIQTFKRIQELRAIINEIETSHSEADRIAESVKSNERVDFHDARSDKELVDDAIRNVNEEIEQLKAELWGSVKANPTFLKMLADKGINKVDVLVAHDEYKNEQQAEVIISRAGELAEKSETQILHGKAFNEKKAAFKEKISQLTEANKKLRHLKQEAKTTLVDHNPDADYGKTYKEIVAALKEAKNALEADLAGMIEGTDIKEEQLESLQNIEKSKEDLRELIKQKVGAFLKEEPFIVDKGSVSRLTKDREQNGDRVEVERQVLFKSFRDDWQNGKSRLQRLSGVMVDKDISALLKEIDADNPAELLTREWEKILEEELRSQFEVDEKSKKVTTLFNADRSKNEGLNLSEKIDTLTKVVIDRLENIGIQADFGLRSRLDSLVADIKRDFSDSRYYSGRALFRLNKSYQYDNYRNRTDVVYPEIEITKNGIIDYESVLRELERTKKTLSDLAVVLDEFFRTETRPYSNETVSELVTKLETIYTASIDLIESPSMERVPFGGIDNPYEMQAEADRANQAVEKRMSAIKPILPTLTEYGILQTQRESLGITDSYYLKLEIDKIRNKESELNKLKQLLEELPYLRTKINNLLAEAGLDKLTDIRVSEGDSYCDIYLPDLQDLDAKLKATKISLADAEADVQTERNRKKGIFETGSKKEASLAEKMTIASQIKFEKEEIERQIALMHNTIRKIREMIEQVIKSTSNSGEAIRGVTLDDLIQALSTRLNDSLTKNTITEEERVKVVELTEIQNQLKSLEDKLGVKDR